MAETIVFMLLALVVIGSALAVVLLRNLVHSALYLTLCFAGIAGLYIMLNADFVAAAQLLVYTGGVAVIIIFGIMLTRRENMDESNPYNNYGISAAVVCTGLFIMTSLMIVNTGWVKHSDQPVPETTVDEISRLMFTDYVMPFEAAAILLLVALVGAIIMAKGVKDTQ